MTLSFGWSPELNEAIRGQFRTKNYPMNLATEDGNSVMSAVNQGIDSYLEACFVPDRGDSYKWYGSRLDCEVSPTSLPTLVRRLLESNDVNAELLASSICSTLDIELI